MERFKFDTLERWQELEPGFIYTRETTKNTRRIHLEFMATDHVVIWAWGSDPEKKMPVCIGSGRMTLETSVSGAAHFQIECKKGARVFGVDHAQEQRYIKTEGAESFLETDLTPGRIDAQYQELVRVLNAQNDARFANLQKEIAKLANPSGAE